MRVLLTGASGQLGTDIVHAAQQRGGIELHGYNRSTLDITDFNRVLGAFAAVKPDVVIHTAAYTAVDDCESNPDEAMAVNGDGTANIVKAAEEFGARVVYVSTDYVFDGSKDGPYVETDTPNPASVYGSTKLAGEQHVTAIGDEGLVVRTSWVCGMHGSNMVKTIINAAEKYPQLTFVDDQIGKPTFTQDLAPRLLELAANEASGIAHVTNEGVVSWYEFCRAVLEELGRDPDQVQPCSTSELDPPRPAPRPANSVLANTRFDELGIAPLRPYREPLAQTIRDLTN